MTGKLAWVVCKCGQHASVGRVGGVDGVLAFVS